MTGPHLTPEREAEIRAAQGRGVWGTDVLDLLAALDAEREAHAQTRTALEASTERQIGLAYALRHYTYDHAENGPCECGACREIRASDAQIQANQVALQLAVAEADKPHDGNER